jgi:hypothetical protein
MKSIFSITWYFVISMDDGWCMIIQDHRTVLWRYGMITRFAFQEKKNSFRFLGRNIFDTVLVFFMLLNGEHCSIVT